MNAREGLEKIKPEYADARATGNEGMGDLLGATHYSHWFQPLTRLQQRSMIHL